jgi:Fur family transcriptional regulator, ferric uptake regulator
MISSLTQQWLENLQTSGYRLTPARKAVVEILADSHKALDPQMVYDLAREKHPELGVMTVYRTLEKLEELGLALRVHQPSGCHAYAAAPQGHQHLLLCLQCHRVEYFGGDELENLFSAIGSQKNFLIKDHWLQLFGLCDKCKKMGVQ